MTDGGETMFVAVDDAAGRIVGFAAFKEAEIYGLYVAPESIRGGVGGALLDAAEAAMRLNGVREVKFRSTFTALTFYQRHGYQRGADGISRMGGVEIPCVWMSKSL